MLNKICLYVKMRHLHLRDISTRIMCYAEHTSSSTNLLLCSRYAMCNAFCWELEQRGQLQPGPNHISKIEHTGGFTLTTPPARSTNKCIYIYIFKNSYASTLLGADAPVFVPKFSLTETTPAISNVVHNRLFFVTAVLCQSSLLRSPFHSIQCGTRQSHFPSAYLVNLWSVYVGIFSHE